MDTYLVVLGAIVSILLGALWYSSLMFGKKWQKESGMGESRLKELKEKKNEIFFVYGINFCLSFVSSIVLYTLVVAGFQLVEIFALWAAFSLPIFADRVLWERKSVVLFLINAGYHLVALSFMVSIFEYFA